MTVITLAITLVINLPTTCSFSRYAFIKLPFDKLYSSSSKTKLCIYLYMNCYFEFTDTTGYTENYSLLRLLL